jgi:hypothetical protein
MASEVDYFSYELMDEGIESETEQVVTGGGVHKTNQEWGVISDRHYGTATIREYSMHDEELADSSTTKELLTPFTPWWCTLFELQSSSQTSKVLDIWVDIESSPYTGYKREYNFYRVIAAFTALCGSDTSFYGEKKFSSEISTRNFARGRVQAKTLVA